MNNELDFKVYAYLNNSKLYANFKAKPFKMLLFYFLLFNRGRLT